jgi:sortase A
VALALWLYNIWDEQRAAISAESAVVELNMALLDEYSDRDVEAPDYRKYPDMEMPTVKIDGEYYIGRLEVPAIELRLPVMSEWSYPKLKIAPCRYSGSAYKNNMVIAAHNYKSHFGYIGMLPIGSLVTFTDADNNVFYYNVAEIEQIQPNKPEQMKEGDWDLTLFTCTLSGKYRTAVRCVAVEQTN